MTIQDSYPAVTRVASEWRKRLRRSREELARNPHHERAWYWQLQIKILSFFLSRYGNDPRLDWTPPAASLPAWPRQLPFRRVQPPPKPIHEILGRIAAVNGHRWN